MAVEVWVVPAIGLICSTGSSRIESPHIGHSCRSATRLSRRDIGTAVPALTSGGAAPHTTQGPRGTWQNMHDYYRIAEISGTTGRAPTRAVPAWAVTAHAMPASSPRTPPPALHLVRALEPERPMERLLRDEVALDFPSGQQALDHARRDFAESDGPVVSTVAEVTLTSIEARRSARVPLCLHVPALCEPCGGRGEAWDERCEACDGAGTAIAMRYVVVRVPANTVDGTTLRYRLALPYGPLVRLDVRLTVR